MFSCQAARIQAHRRSTGGGSALDEQLTPLEQKIQLIIGQAAYQGRA